MRELPVGIAQKLQDLEDEDDDEVDYSVPNTWGANNASKPFRSATESQLAASTISASIAISDSARSSEFAPAFIPFQRKHDPYESTNQCRAFSFANIAPSALETPQWDFIDPDVEKQGKDARHLRQTPSRTASNQLSSDDEFADIFASRNNALEGTFGTDSAIRVTDDGSGETVSRSWSIKLDTRFENPNLDVDPNIRANFLPIDRLHEASSIKSEVARRNPLLVASNTSGIISTIIAGEKITYTPLPVDKRLKFLDRHGKYFDDKDRGQIKKRLKLQHKRDILERDRQMVQAAAEYRALASMTPKERTMLLESLRRPLVFIGAFEADQKEVRDIPIVYTRGVTSSKVMRWMGHYSLLSGSPSQLSRAPSVQGSVTSRRSEEHDEFIQGGFDDDDDFAANSSYIPLLTSLPRDNLYFADALYFGRTPSGGVQAPRPPESLNRIEITPCSTSTHSNSTQEPPKSLTASIGYRTDPGEVRSIYASYASSGRNDDPLDFDDTPEFQVPQDSSIELIDPLGAEKDHLYNLAYEISLKHGRVVMIRLHEPVVFSPGSISQRIFCGTIQEIQLFPTQRLAIAVFLHPSEAKSFLRHIKNTYMHGRAEEVRALQIDAGWFGDSENKAILAIQPNIFRHLVAEKASRTLRLHRIPLEKTVGEVSSELGARMSKGLLRVILCSPRQDYLKKQYGRQAVIEFMSVKDAIEARIALADGLIYGYDNTEPEFMKDASEHPYEEKRWCKCIGCRSQREDKESAKGVSSRASTVSS